MTIVFMAVAEFLPESVLPLDSVERFCVYLAVYVLIGWDVIHNALHGVFHGEVFDENLLMVVATVGAFGLALFERNGDYSEAISVILLFQIGEYFQSYAVTKSRNRIRSVVGLDAGAIVETDDNAAKAERFITRFARVYTPLVCIGALALAVVPPLFSEEPFAAVLPVWIYRALMFLVMSCPCALVISIPLTFFAGIVGAGRNGVLFMGCNIIERLAKGGEVNYAVASIDSVEDVKAADIILTNEGCGDIDGCNVMQADDIRKKRMIAENVSRHTLSIVWQNIIFAIGIKVVCLCLGAFGIANMWLAVFADTGVMILAVLNALRALRTSTTSS